MLELDSITTNYLRWHKDRTFEPLTWSNAPIAHAWIAVFLFMAYLTRRPYTYVYRLLILPLVVYHVLWCTMRYRVEDPKFSWYNWLRGMLSLATIAHAITFVIYSEGLLKRGEGCLSSGTRQRWNRQNIQTPQSRVNIPACILDAFEVGLLVRGIGWQYAHGVHVPEARRPSERSSYLVWTLVSVMRAYLYVDFIHAMLATLPGITTSTGTSHFQALPPVPRYLVAIVLHILAGLVIILGLEMSYDIVSLVGVGVLNQPPSSWPPFHDKPWLSSSLHEFWSKRWHQALRQTFLVYGGYPGRWIAGDLGMLFGTFIASGLFHEIGLYLAGEQMDPRVALFFFAQPFGILAEKLYKKHTGRRVDGILGKSVVILFAVVLGQSCTDSWLRRGIGGKTVVPPALSPARRFIIPYLQRLAKHYENQSQS